MTPPPTWPGTPPKPKKTNWEAIGAVAGVVGVLVALAASVSGTTPNPPASMYTPSRQYTGIPPVTPRNGGPPAGCELGPAAITRYNNTVGSTLDSQQQAAARAYQDLDMAASGIANATIREDLFALGRDFNRLEPENGAPAGSSQYNAVLAQIQKDSQALSADCGDAG